MLVAAMENNRDNFVVAAAGYPEKMKEFLDYNPGMKSRFPTFINFDTFSTEQLGLIMDQMLADSSCKMTPKVRAFALEKIEDERKRCTAEDKQRRRDPSFGNGRVVRNLVEQVEGYAAVRLEELGVFDLAEDKQDKKLLTQITREDVEQVCLENIQDPVPKVTLGFQAAAASAKTAQASAKPKRLPATTAGLS